VTTNSAEGTLRSLCSLNIGGQDRYRNLMGGWPKANDADYRRQTLKPCHEHRRPPDQIQPPIFWSMGRTALRLARGRRRFRVPSPCCAVHQRSELHSSASGGLANSLRPSQRMADRAGMSDPGAQGPSAMPALAATKLIRSRNTRSFVARPTTTLPSASSRMQGKPRASPATLQEYKLKLVE
jgi:hypothetical protein